MNPKQHEGANLDELLKRALSDDLPADVAAGMRDRIDRFRAGTTRDEGRMAAWAWFFRRSVWAVLSILMLLSGIFLQASRSRNPLADRISVIKTDFARSEAARPPGVAFENREIAPDGRPL